MIFPRSAWKWPTFAIACGAALQLASGTTPEYYIQDAGAGGATCDIKGGSVVKTELECREAAIALYDSPNNVPSLETAFNDIPRECEDELGCEASWEREGTTWTYTTAYDDFVFASPSGCVTSAKPAVPDFAPYVGWVAGARAATCGTGGVASMFCICKTGPTTGPTGSPTTGPTGSPTTGPTGSPTTAGPTGSPTTGPTGSPTTAGPTGSPTTAGPTGTPPKYFIRDAGAGGATCAINGGSVVKTELECREAVIALYDSPNNVPSSLETAFNDIPTVCEIPSGCTASWLGGGRMWTYTTAYDDSLFPSPSGCVTSAEPAEPNDSPYAGWVAGDREETCGTGGVASMLCICKTGTYGPTGSPTTAGPTGSPTTGPTGSPTTAGPTGSPTTGPTGSPTTTGPTGSPTTTGPTGQSTTPAITSAPWTIDFAGMDSDFSSSSGDEVVMRYEIGKDRAYEASLHEKDCAAGIADVTVNTTKARANINETHDLLTLSHSFDKSAIGNSTIWDNEAGKIEICQIVRLILPEGDGQVKMDIVEDTREVDIDFTLSADFAIENELGAGSVESAAGETNVSSYVSACKCNGPGNFSCNPEPLVPNTQLHVCITSVSADVQVKELKSMVVKQGAALMNVVLGGLVQISSIADRTYVEAENGVVVSTFVPTNVFDYAAGASINITGGIDMELASSARRLLADAVDGDAVDAYGNGQEFDLRVDLQDEAIVLEGEGDWVDSSGALLGGASALLGAALLLAYGMW